MMKFEDYLNETLLIEMPHIMIKDKVVDLEFEVHSSMNPKDFKKYLEAWIDGKPIQSKNPNLVMKLDASMVKDFITKFLKNGFAKAFIIKHYGEKMWSDIESILMKKLSTDGGI